VSDIDLVLHRLAEADPAPAGHDMQPLAPSSVLLDTIREGSGPMNAHDITPWWRRGPIVAAAVFLLIVAAGTVIATASSDDSEAVATATTLVTTTTTATTTTSPTPAVLAIEIEQTWPENAGEPFHASGPAVDAGTICSEGTTDMFNLQYNQAEQTEVWEEVFTCSDGSGTFRMEYSASYLTVGEKVKYSGGWKIISGTGAYEALAGSGRISNGANDDLEAPFMWSGEVTLDS
jgi:hypothetical protein